MQSELDAEFAKSGSPICEFPLQPCPAVGDPADTSWLCPPSWLCQHRKPGWLRDLSLETSLPDQLTVPLVWCCTGLVFPALAATSDPQLDLGGDLDSHLPDFPSSTLSLLASTMSLGQKLEPEEWMSPDPQTWLFIS